MSNFTIRLSRPGMNGPARIYKIQVDGFDAGKLGSKSTIDIPATEGTHTVAFCWAGKTERIINVTLDENNPLAEINVSLDMMGKLNLSLVIGMSTATPQQEPRKKKIGCFSVVGIVLSVILVIVVIAAIGSVDSKDSQSSGKPSASSAVTTAPTSTSQPVFEPVGGTVSNWEITVNGFEYKDNVSVGLLHQYSSSENAKYCLVNVTVKNIGTESQTFLPYISFGNDPVAKVSWNGYEYTRSELLFANDMLSSEQLNPLVTATGDIVFDVPEDLINSDIPPTFIVNAGNETFSCELMKK